ncbi:MAG: UDP-N-acetylmuramoyl-L-alanyl-D-glutamate--2,6-diaminopimelate ligase [Desulfobacteraceae bacterium]|jgi:UDP-N-acetylmuramyl-tripeptide synthetase
MKLTELISTMGIMPDDCQSKDGQSVCNPEIRGIACRAQEISPGGLFVAVKGFAADGHDFIGQAVSQGASAVVCEQPADVDVATVTVENSRKALAELAAVFYGNPSQKMIVIGITGTNGKTTTSYLVESILAAAGISVGVIGTINYRYGGRIYDNPVTTPESVDLQRILAEMHTAGVTHVVMEVSSHALDLYRVHRCHFDLAVFTNFTQDHLDYHQDMARYWACKRKLFMELLPTSSSRLPLRAVINVAVPKGLELAREMTLPFMTCGDNHHNDLNPQAAHFDLDGTNARVSTPHGGINVSSPLVGRHNLENILNAAGVGIALDIPLDTIAAGIQSLGNVPGRLERISNVHRRYVYVDYAHTPDALESSLLALRALTADRIICVFGCGGDRDRAKRPEMGGIAARLSDLAVVTSDNPRTEPPLQIIEEIVAGVRLACDLQYAPEELKRGFKAKGYTVIADRREAIAMAVSVSRPGDTVLIAGKGHEPYQLIGREKFPFDDRLEAEKALAGLR